ncbi:MAG: hypothetical protein IID15_00350 [Candidatus Marinimicrobia bacterium]|nr:hypothetical protein [Candidatus Neomarinimicrobiota bacterium]
MDKKSGTVLNTLRDIESLFEFGGEIAPFLEELFTFLTDLMPILARANQSLASTTESIPTATDNIASADEMAQNAANTIMDNADQITTALDDLLAKSDGETKAALEEVMDKVNEINMALQYQDITSQHLKQATQIVEAIQVRMQKLFQGLQAIGENNEAIRKLVESYSTEMEADDASAFEDTIHNSADAISQDEIDALFGK